MHNVLQNISYAWWFWTISFLHKVHKIMLSSLCSITIIWMYPWSIWIVFLQANIDWIQTRLDTKREKNGYIQLCRIKESFSSDSNYKVKLYNSWGSWRSNAWWWISKQKTSVSIHLSELQQGQGNLRRYLTLPYIELIWELYLGNVYLSTTTFH